MIQSIEFRRKGKTMYRLGFCIKNSEVKISVISLCVVKFVLGQFIKTQYWLTAQINLYKCYFLSSIYFSALEIRWERKGFGT